ncbi:HNH endonuclease [Amycolatopsis granulosa]|uniref:HNH endonuclease n=1 Tax=Amycolatopsis granulosa TaxID=185684 RepID=UPI001ABA56E3|nr:putative restriction endonuclease [Amycolatopsis granulosa]
MDLEAEVDVRHRIMARLQEAVDASPSGTLSRRELSAFEVDGRTWRLLDQGRGIRNPKDLQATLTIMTSLHGPYGDEPMESGLFRYHYQSSSDAGDNTKLRRACELQLPLILFWMLEPGLYVPVFPVYVVADDRPNRVFLIALDEGLRFLPDPMDPGEAAKRYAHRIARRRLHQPVFRASVLRAYEVRCAVCRLQHGNLLDAAHIIPDGADHGAPIVSNGLSLCKIHHAAYDNQQLGISPDYRVHIAPDLLVEVDGPMLRHGLQEMHGQLIGLPSRPKERPDRDRLDERYQQFLRAS